MCIETSSREATNCPGCGQTFAFLEYHVPHCPGSLSPTKRDLVAEATKRSKDAATANNRQPAKRRGH